MPFYPPLPSTVRAQAQKQRVDAALFVTFGFKSLLVPPNQPLRIWEGDGLLNREGKDWYGIGQRQDGSGNPLQSIDGLEQAINGTAPQLTLTLNGVDAKVVNAAKKDAEADEIEGRDLKIEIGFFLETPAAWVPLDNLLHVGTWVMQKPSFTAQNATLRTITLPCETMFSQRSRSPFGMLTDRDQQRRFPGDRALEFIPKMIDRTVTWPEF